MNINSLGNFRPALKSLDASLPNNQYITKSTESLFSLQKTQSGIPNNTEIQQVNTLSIIAKSPPLSPSLVQSLKNLDLQSEKIAKHANELAALPSGEIPFGNVLIYQSELLQWSASAHLLSSTTKSLQDGLQQMFKNN